MSKNKNKKNKNKNKKKQKKKGGQLRAIFLNVLPFLQPTGKNINVNKQPSTQNKNTNKAQI